MDGLAVATYLNNCILFTTRKTNVKKLNGGDESKIDNLFEQKALDTKIVPARFVNAVILLKRNTLFDTFISWFFKSF